MSDIETEIEKYELACASRVWDALSEDDRSRLLIMPIEKQRMLHWQGKDGKKFYGAYAEWAAYTKEHGYTNTTEGDWIDLPAMANLITIGLAVDGWQSIESQLIGSPTYPNPGTYLRTVQGYSLTGFGRIVARFGRAKLIVGKAEAMRGASGAT